MNHDTFLVRRYGYRESIYRAWQQQDGSYSATINCGRVPGRVINLSAKDFWKLFERVPGASGGA